MGNPRNYTPTAVARRKALTPAPRTHRTAPLLSSGRHCPRQAAAAERRAEMAAHRCAPPLAPLEAPSASPVRPGPAPPEPCPGKTKPRSASVPPRPPRNPPCCSARCLAPFTTGGARNPGKDIPPPPPPPQPPGLCLPFQIPDGYR